MGSCASSPVHKTPVSTMKLWLSLRSSNHVVPSSSRTSPVKEKPLQIEPSFAVDDAVLKSHSSQPNKQVNLDDFGSKEETFYQSYPWLESDPDDDDFFSVNGDFTPSRGNTPVHHNFSIKSPKPQASPNEKTQKSLFELFRESIRENLHNNNDDQDCNIVATSTIDHPSISVNSSPYFSGTTSSVCASTPTRLAFNAINDKSYDRSVQCCVPRLFSSRGFMNKKNSMMIGH